MRRSARSRPAWLPVGSQVHVRKLRPDRTEVFAWDGVVLRCDDEGIVLRAMFNVQVVDLGFTAFRRGDVFQEFYYWDRWYNVFEVLEPDGQLKGWYANVGAPAELDPAAGQLSYVDLALDLWSDPSGAIQLLDEDEFTAHAARGTYDASLVAGARRGWQEVVELARSGNLPRWSGSDDG